ncbi:MAG: iron chelate uptake ABC transporter family permease subunit, partial [Alphaproteobacteria bacterium]|nr:iron chelate uptake ABC transporter family permease subunit [Alphaproteobacteria bacterium]
MPILLAILLLVLFFLNLFVGSAEIPAAEIFKVLTGQSDNEVYKIIILENRLPQAVTALLAGAALAVSGLIMQTVFANPLAGPSVLGISSAASLGVAVVTFLFSTVFMDFNSTVSVII